jgi:hypothetical protein
MALMASPVPACESGATGARSFDCSDEMPARPSARGRVGECSQASEVGNGDLASGAAHAERPQSRKGTRQALRRDAEHAGNEGSIAGQHHPDRPAFGIPDSSRARRIGARSVLRIHPPRSASSLTHGRRRLVDLRQERHEGGRKRERGTFANVNGSSNFFPLVRPHS